MTQLKLDVMGLNVVERTESSSLGKVLKKFVFLLRDIRVVTRRIV